MRENSATCEFTDVGMKPTLIQFFKKFQQVTGLKQKGSDYKIF